jgi:hypothetical protein
LAALAVLACCLQVTFGLATPVLAQHSPELSSLDVWIVQRYRGAQLLPDSNGQSTSTVTRAGAPRIEASRSTTRRDTVVALHFGTALWKPALGAASAVQLVDPTGAISVISGRVTARRAFRTPRSAGARDSVKGEWRIGWAYLVAIPRKTANAAASGFNGWALVEAASKTAEKPAAPIAAPVTAPQSSSATLPPIR